MGSSNDNNSPSNLWTRRSNSNKINLTNNKNDNRDENSTPSTKRFNSFNKNNSLGAIGAINTQSAAPPTTATGASSAFGLGSGAFASFGASNKTPKTPGAAFDQPKGTSDRKESSEEEQKEREHNRRPPPPRKSLSSYRGNSGTPTADPPASSAKDATNNEPYPLKNIWILYYRPPTSKNSDYEKSIKPQCRIHSVGAFWSVYSHLKRPSDLPTVSDYHIFKEGIRPVWEDEENRRGGKWTMRLKKGVADRYWEDLLLALVGDQFAEAGEEVCGVVVSVRSGEDIFSIWTKNDGGRNVKIRETIKRVLNLPPDTNLQWRSHDESITQRSAIDEARQKATLEKRRNTLVIEKDKKDEENS